MTAIDSPHRTIPEVSYGVPDDGTATSRSCASTRSA